VLSLWVSPEYSCRKRGFFGVGIRPVPQGRHTRQSCDYGLGRDCSVVRGYASKWRDECRDGAKSPLRCSSSSNVGRPAVQARKLVRLQRSTGDPRPCTSTPGNGGRLWRFRIHASLSLRGFRRGPSRHRGFGQVVSILGCFTAFGMAGGFRCRGHSRANPLTGPRVVFGQCAPRSPRSTRQRHQRSSVPIRASGTIRVRIHTQPSSAQAAPRVTHAWNRLRSPVFGVNRAPTQVDGRRKTNH
jgi:hypothetical protein